MQDKLKLVLGEVLSTSINELLAYLQTGRKPRELYVVRVSDVVSCLRRAYLNYILSVSPDTLHTATGRLLHSHFAKLVQEAARSLEGVEVLIEPRYEYRLFTRIDRAQWRLVAEPDIVLRAHGKTVVIEFKTCYSSLSRRILESYIKQLSTYIVLAEAEFGLLIILDRKLRIRIRRVPRDKAERNFQDVVKRARELVECVERVKPPDPEPGPWCATCIYREQRLCIVEPRRAESRTG